MGFDSRSTSKLYILANKNRNCKHLAVLWSKDLYKMTELNTWYQIGSLNCTYQCNLCIENQTVLKIETVLISIMFLKLPLYWSYNRVIQKIFNTVLIIESVLIIETKEYSFNLKCLRAVFLALFVRFESWVYV